MGRQRTTSKPNIAFTRDIGRLRSSCAEQPAPRVMGIRSSVSPSCSYLTSRGVEDGFTRTARAGSTIAV